LEKPADCVGRVILQPGAGRSWREKQVVTLQTITELKRRYAGNWAVVDPRQPELARWADVPGQIRAINSNGRALVQFEGADQGWHDIAPDHLRLVARPAPAP
jgi:hypothetical protein